MKAAADKAALKTSAGAARRQVVTALGLVNRAKADLETVRETCPDEPLVVRACADACAIILDARDRLSLAEYLLRFGPSDEAMRSSISAAQAAVDGLPEKLGEASEIVRDEALRDRSTPVMWLAEADGALSHVLVTAVQAAEQGIKRSANSAAAA